MPKVQLVNKNDNRYPKALKILNQMPDICLIGDIENDTVKVGIIGSRRPTAYGLRFTNDLSSQLAKAGIITVSGFARGIDSCCHKATIEADGKTIAVMGSGIDVIYPPENKSLYNQICLKGALISEFKQGTPPFKHNFPRRNRFISALCDLLVVVEAAEKSGTLITVDFALDQGKDVMVLPGSIYSKQSNGTNNLIKQGAEPIMSVSSVLERLNIKPDANKAKRESIILQILDDNSMGLEEIANATGKRIDEISMELTGLQIEGLVKEDLAGMFYRIT